MVAPVGRSFRLGPADLGRPEGSTGSVASLPAGRISEVASLQPGSRRGARPPVRPSPPDPAGATGPWAAERHATTDPVTARSLRGRRRSGMRVLGLDALGPLQLQGPEGPLDARELRGGGLGQ